MKPTLDIKSEAELLAKDRAARWLARHESTAAKIDGRRKHPGRKPSSKIDFGLSRLQKEKP